MPPRPIWPSSFTAWPADAALQKQWFTIEENKNFDDPNSPNLEFAIQTVVGINKAQWLAYSRKACQDALDSHDIKPGKWVTEECETDAADNLYKRLKDTFTLSSFEAGDLWLKSVSKAIGPRVVQLCRKHAAKRTRPTNEQDSDSSAKSSKKTKSSTESAPKRKRNKALPSLNNTLSIRQSIEPITSSKRTQVVQGVGARTPSLQNEDMDDERTHKSSKPSYDRQLQCLDRAIVVRIQGRDLPFVVGMHALVEPSEQQRGLDNLIHIHLSWIRFQSLLSQEESRLEGDEMYDADSMSVKWRNPITQMTMVINNQQTFVNAVGILGYAARDQTYIEMTLS